MVSVNPFYITKKKKKQERKVFRRENNMLWKVRNLIKSSVPQLGT